ncbi:MAG: glycosyl transferase [Leptospira sp.]|nr:glycosyl transferase [Leptospira sp.]
MTQGKYRILYYVSSHGYGHISRSYEIIRTLLERDDIEFITLCTERLDFIKDDHPKLEKRKVNVDVGVIQKDSLSLDVHLTKEKLQEFEKNKNSLILRETEFAREKNYDLIISDSSSLPFVLGVSLEIPALFLGNFTWDFIYRNFAKYDPYFHIIADILAVEYSFATAAVLLPFTCPMDGFLETHNLGLVGRKPTLSKQEARKEFGFLENEIYFLFSFGAYGLDGMDWNWENIPDNWRIVVNNLPSLKHNKVIDVPSCYYPNLVTACDYIVTKPGYGILSECILANSPIIYTDRGDFAEYPYLVEELNRNFLASYITQKDLLNFSFANCLTEIKNKSNIMKDSNFDDGTLKIHTILTDYLAQ